MRTAPNLLAVTLFFTSFFTYAFFFQSVGPNEAARFDSIHAFVKTGTVIIDEFAANSADVIQVNGHTFSGKAPGTFFLGLIPYALFETVLSVTGIRAELRSHWVNYLTTLSVISLLGALSVVLFFRIGKLADASDVSAATVALSIGLGTSFFPFATMFFSHVATVFCFAAAFFLLYNFRLHALKSETVEKWRLPLAGFALGFSIVLEYPAVIGASFLAGYFFWSLRSTNPHRLGTGLRFTLGFLLGLTPLFAYNAFAFGDPFYLTYEAYAQSGNSAFPAHMQGVLGVRIPLWDWSFWPQFLANLFEITFKPLRGLFFNNPVLIFIFAGFWISLRRRSTPEGWLAFLMFFAYLTFNACFGNSVTYWGGGASFGPRHLLVTLPFLTIPLLSCLQNTRLRAGFAPIATLSIFICLVATAVEPRTPYTPENPLFFFYLPRFTTGVLAINHLGTFSTELLTSNSVAFNWGKLLGLPIAWQLTPLYVVWTIAARRLDRQLEIRERGIFYATAILVLIAAWIPIAALS